GERRLVAQPELYRVRLERRQPRAGESQDGHDEEQRESDERPPRTEQLHGPARTSVVGGRRERRGGAGGHAQPSCRRMAVRASLRAAGSEGPGPRLTPT